MTGGVPQVDDPQRGDQDCTDHPQAGHGGETLGEQRGSGHHDPGLHVPHVHSGAAGRGH